MAGKTVLVSDLFGEELPDDKGDVDRNEDGKRRRVYRARVHLDCTELNEAWSDDLCAYFREARRHCLRFRQNVVARCCAGELDARTRSVSLSGGVEVDRHRREAAECARRGTRERPGRAGGTRRAGSTRGAGGTRRTGRTCGAASTRDAGGTRRTGRTCGAAGTGGTRRTGRTCGAGRAGARGTRRTSRPGRPNGAGRAGTRGTRRASRTSRTCGAGRAGTRRASRPGRPNGAGRAGTRRASRTGRASGAGRAGTRGTRRTSRPGRPNGAGRAGTRGTRRASRTSRTCGAGRAGTRRASRPGRASGAGRARTRGTRRASRPGPASSAGRARTRGTRRASRPGWAGCAAAASAKGPVEFLLVLRAATRVLAVRPLQIRRGDLCDPDVASIEIDARSDRRCVGDGRPGCFRRRGAGEQYKRTDGYPEEQCPCLTPRPVRASPRRFGCEPSAHNRASLVAVSDVPRSLTSAEPPAGG